MKLPIELEEKIQYKKAKNQIEEERF